MHAGDGGVLGHLHASAFKHMARGDGPCAGNEDQRVDKLWVDLLESYIATGITKRLQILTLHMIKGPEPVPFLENKVF